MSGGESKKAMTVAAIFPHGVNYAQPKSFVRRFRWLLIGGGLVVLLLLLVMLAPMLASMGWAKSIILGRSMISSMDARGQGMGPQLVRRPRAARGAALCQGQIAAGGDEAVRTELSVWDVVFGDMYNLGKTKVEGLAVNFKQYNDGTTNFSNLVKKTTVKKPPPPGTKEQETTVLWFRHQGRF